LKLSDLVTRNNFNLDYGALWSYSPYGKSKEELLSKSYRYAVKNDETVTVSGKEVPMSEVVAQSIRESLITLPFRKLFEEKPILVPVTRSSLMKPDTLWVPHKIALALRKVGLGSMVSLSLTRRYAVGYKATAKEHHDSQGVIQGLLDEPEAIVLIDDFVTRGATLVGSAQRLCEAYPNARIAAFAAIRTVTLSENFKKIDDPVYDKITLYASGKTHRDPN
jgi:hypothetical protein